MISVRSNWPGVLAVDAEVGLQRHLHLDARRHVDERAARPDRAVERGELVVARRDDRAEVLAHQLGVLPQRGVHVAEQDALGLQLLPVAVVDDLGVVDDEALGHEVVVAGDLDVVGRLDAYGLDRLETDEPEHVAGVGPERRALGRAWRCGRSARWPRRAAFLRRPQREPIEPAAQVQPVAGDPRERGRADERLANAATELTWMPQSWASSAMSSRSASLPLVMTTFVPFGWARTVPSASTKPARKARRCASGSPKTQSGHALGQRSTAQAVELDELGERRGAAGDHPLPVGGERRTSSPSCSRTDAHAPRRSSPSSGRRRPARRTGSPLRSWR